MSVQHGSRMKRRICDIASERSRRRRGRPPAVRRGRTGADPGGRGGAAARRLGLRGGSPRGLDADRPHGGGRGSWRPPPSARPSDATPGRRRPARALDALERKPAERATAAPALRRPMAWDLRMPPGSMRVATSSERIGGLARDVAARGAALGPDARTTSPPRRRGWGGVGAAGRGVVGPSGAEPAAPSPSCGAPGRSTPSARA